MEKHHQDTIDKVTAHFRDDERFLALIIAGSVPRGWGAPNSDIDIVLVATDEEFGRRAANEDYLYFTQDFCDYEDGYVDGKVIDRQFLREAAHHGSEPARSAFVGAYLVFCRDPEIETLLAQIPVYPEAEREAKLRAFYGQVLLLRWYVDEAHKRQNAYLMMHVVSDLVLFGARLILAYNRILYPYHKWMLKAVEEAPDKPADFLQRIDELLKNPSPETADAFLTCINEFRDWGLPFHEAVIEFMKNSEWNWRDGRPPLADW